MPMMMRPDMNMAVFCALPAMIAPMMLMMLAVQIPIFLPLLSIRVPVHGPMRIAPMKVAQVFTALSEVVSWKNSVYEGITFKDPISEPSKAMVMESTTQTAITRAVRAFLPRKMEVNPMFMEQLDGCLE